MKPTEVLSRFIVETPFEDLPEEVLGLVKTSVLDTLGCGIAGITVEKKVYNPC